jgi:hypothetical protein
MSKLTRLQSRTKCLAKTATRTSTGSSKKISENFSLKSSKRSSQILSSREMKMTRTSKVSSSIAGTTMMKKMSWIN